MSIDTQSRRAVPADRAGTGHTKRRRTPGDVGAWEFILGDIVIFGCFFVGYLVARGNEPEIFAESQQHLTQFYGAFNTLVLLAGSLFVVIGMHTIRNGTRTAQRAFAAAMVTGAIFGLLKILEWGSKIADDITPATNNFYMWYWSLTGLHFFHLILGMCVLALLYRKARRVAMHGDVVTRRQYEYAEAGALFWHLVDLLWIVIWPLLYLVH